VHIDALTRKARALPNDVCERARAAMSGDVRDERRGRDPVLDVVTAGECSVSDR
jgi:hypothetical protein